MAPHQAQTGNRIRSSVHLHMHMQRDTLQAQPRNLLVSSCSSQSGKLPRHLRRAQCRTGQFTYEIQVIKHTTDPSPLSSFHIAPDPAPHPPKQLLLGGQMTWRSHKSSSDGRIHVRTCTQAHSPLLPGVDRACAECKIKALTAHCNAWIGSRFPKLPSPVVCR